MSNFFHSDCNNIIMNGTYKGWADGRRVWWVVGEGGWVVGDGWWWGRVGGWVKPFIKTQTAILCSVSDTNSLNSQDRPRQSLAAAWHHTHPY